MNPITLTPAEALASALFAVLAFCYAVRAKWHADEAGRIAKAFVEGSENKKDEVIR